MKKLGLLFILGFLFVSQNIFAQYNQTIGEIEYDESLLYAQVKQVNQFFRRFNCEEDAKGIKYSVNDPMYHNNELRQQYFESVFDKYSILVSRDNKQRFSRFALNSENPYYLDFYKTEWYAEVSAKVMWHNELRDIIYFFQLEAEGEGHKWVVSNIYFSPFDELYPPLPDSVKKEHFLHPKSHEIDFINLPKEFRDPQFFSSYLYQSYFPDPISIYLYELKKGNIQFHSINSTKFHFFADQQWYFEVLFFNRNEINAGWLISNLLPLNDEEYREIRRTFNSSK